MCILTQNANTFSNITIHSLNIPSKLDELPLWNASFIRLAEFDFENHIRKLSAYESKQNWRIAQNKKMTTTFLVSQKVNYI